MYSSTSRFSTLGLGKCVSSVLLKDSGDACIELEAHAGTPEYTSSRLEVPNGLLDKLLTEVLSLANMERARDGRPALEFVYLDEDEDDL